MAFLSLRSLLISSGVFSMAVILKLSVPVVSDFVVTELPSIWSFMLSWLRPPYLYILINGIIISIVAASKLQNKTEDPAAEMMMVVPPTPVKVSGDVPTEYDGYGSGVVLGGYGYDAVNAAKVSVSVAEVEKKVNHDETVMVMMNGGDEDVVERPVLRRKDSLEFSVLNSENEKPPVSARFSHRKNVKASPEAGKALGVSKPKRNETLESTWKTITDGRSMPLTRHLKKSDTWDSHVRRNVPNDENTPPKMKKSETFSDRSSANSSLSPSPGSNRLRKEPSLSQDELNRRVEAFINKFNEDMRLQRQESLNQYQEMIRRGAH